jgi:hypothetical protein
MDNSHRMADCSTAFDADFLPQSACRAQGVA